MALTDVLIEWDILFVVNRRHDLYAIQRWLPSMFQCAWNNELEILWFTQPPKFKFITTQRTLNKCGVYTQYKYCSLLFALFNNKIYIEAKKNDDDENESLLIMRCIQKFLHKVFAHCLLFIIIFFFCQLRLCDVRCAATWYALIFGCGTKPFVLPIFFALWTVKWLGIHNE